MMTLTADRIYTYDDLTETSIVDLVSQAQAGDRAAMDQIYCRFQQHVLSIDYNKLGNWDEAQ